nr:ATP-binding protein [Klebsiella pneumoniae]
MTLISSFRILISTPVMVSQECEKCFYWSSGHRENDYRKSFGAKYQDKYVFVYADDYFKDVCYAAAQKKIPVIIIAEEVDELYRADAGTLSFLDGADTPRNLAGTYVIFSTNYPNRIDPRIRKRPAELTESYL